MVSVIIVYIQKNMCKAASVKLLAIFAVRTEKIGNAIELAAFKKHLAFNESLFIYLPLALRITIRR